MYKNSRIDVCIIPCFNVSLHRVWFIFRNAERTFATAERRNRTAERKTNACSMEMSTGNAK